MNRTDPTVSGDRWIRRGTGAAVLLVAAIAAVISFQHIQHLALTHGQTPLAAALLPLSIDGTVAAADPPIAADGGVCTVHGSPLLVRSGAGQARRRGLDPRHRAATSSGQEAVFLG